jgi:hypothetical protein
VKSSSPAISWLLTRVIPEPVAKAAVPSVSLGVGSPPSDRLLTPASATTVYRNPAGSERIFFGSATSGP